MTSFISLFVFLLHTGSCSFPFGHLSHLVKWGHFDELPLVGEELWVSCAKLGLPREQRRDQEEEEEEAEESGRQHEEGGEWRLLGV